MKMKPSRLNPRWLCIDVIIPGPSGKVSPASFDSITDSAKVDTASGAIPVHPDAHGLADQVLLRNEAPGAAVERLVAVVAHDEVMAFRHPDRFDPAVGAGRIDDDPVRRIAQMLQAFDRAAAGHVAIE